MKKRIDAEIKFKCKHKDCYYHGYCRFAIEEQLGRMYLNPKARITNISMGGHYGNVSSPIIQIECENFKLKSSKNNNDIIRL